jgi:DNA-directed RNA polymerase specialized sigma24 family protein
VRQYVSADFRGEIQAEAAALLGISVPTVKLRWMKARLHVQQALGGSPFDDASASEQAD